MLLRAPAFRSARRRWKASSAAPSFSAGASGGGAASFMPSGRGYALPPPPPAAEPRSEAPAADPRSETEPFGSSESGRATFGYIVFAKSYVGGGPSGGASGGGGVPRAPAGATGIPAEGPSLADLAGRAGLFGSGSAAAAAAIAPSPLAAVAPMWARPDDAADVSGGATPPGIVHAASTGPALAPPADGGTTAGAT